MNSEPFKEGAHEAVDEFLDAWCEMSMQDIAVKYGTNVGEIVRWAACLRALGVTLPRRMNGWRARIASDDGSPRFERQ